MRQIHVSTVEDTVEEQHFENIEKINKKHYSVAQGQGFLHLYTKAKHGT